VRAQRTITVSIPAGASDGVQMRLSGQGDAGLYGGPPGNLFVQLRVKLDPVFRREEFDLHLELPINIAQAALGAEVTVPTLEEPMPLRIPDGTQSGQIFRLRERGVPRLQASGRGDLLITVTVVTPTRLTGEQRRLLEDLAATFDDDATKPAGAEKHERGFFDKVKDVLGLE
jgi:molecular chaperone DnaJ